MTKAIVGQTSVFLQSPLDFAGDLTAVGWQLPDNLTRDQYERAGQLLGKMEDSKQWWLGDWWNAGVQWGEGQAICEKVGVGYQAAADAGWVAREFKFSLRKEKLSFSHHKEVCSLSGNEVRQRFLAWCLIDTDTGEARDKPKSTRELREAVRNFLDEQNWTDSERERRAMVEQGGTVVAHQKKDENLIRWAQFNDCYQKIDRPGDWKNPYVLNEDGDRDTVCEKFAVYFNLKTSLHPRLKELRGKVLGCWCYPERCHGDELIRRLRHGRR